MRNAILKGKTKPFSDEKLEPTLFALQAKFYFMSPTYTLNRTWPCIHPHGLQNHLVALKIFGRKS